MFVIIGIGSYLDCEKHLFGFQGVSVIMGISFVLREGREADQCSVVCRSHDLGGTDYEHVARLTMKEAEGVSASGIMHFLYNHDIPTDTVSARLSIALREDPKPNVRLWKLSCQIEGQEPRTVGYLSDGTVHDLMDCHVDIDFPEGPPDWTAHGDLQTRLTIQGMRQAADEMEAKLAERIMKRETSVDDADIVL